MLISNKDKFGFYTVGDFKTYSKLEAIELSSKVKKPLEWNFNQTVFENFNWAHEPPATLEFWYEPRARHLREKYDYLVLWYSGGADSHNALMSFVNNSIFIDEIAQYHNLDAEHGNKKTWLNEEVFATSAPFTQHLINNNPIYRHTKHRLVDLTDLQAKVLHKESNKWDYFYKVGTYHGPNALARSYIRETLPDYQLLIEQGKSVCFIHGAEKPQVELYNNKWHIAFQDRIDYAVGPRTQELSRSWEHDELFYWTPDMPQLAAKQAHIVKRFLSQLTPASIDNINVSSHTQLQDEYGRRALNSWCADVVVNHVRYQLLPDGLHRLIYPNWKPESIVSPKPTSLTYSPRDSWMFKSTAPDIGQQYYHHGLLHFRELIKKTAPDSWWEFKFDAGLKVPYAGGIKLDSNRYYLE